MSMISYIQMVSEDDYKMLMDHPEKIYEYLYEGEEPDVETYVCLNKSWSYLHFLFTGNPSYGENLTLKDKIILAGTEIGDIDVGYGPAQGSNKEEVKDIANLLNSTSLEELFKNITEKDLNRDDLYPSGFKNLTELFDFIKEYYPKLVDFYNKAVAKGCCVIKFLN